MEQSRTNYTPGVTKEVNTTDVVWSIPKADHEQADKKAVYARIFLSGDKSRFAFGIDPVTGGIGYPRAIDSEIELFGEQEIKAFRIINDTGATQLDITYTVHYK